MWRSIRFCLSVYLSLSPRGISYLHERVQPCETVKAASGEPRRYEPGQSRSGQSFGTESFGQIPLGSSGPDAWRGDATTECGFTRIFRTRPDRSVPAERSLRRIFRILGLWDGEKLCRRHEQYDLRENSEV